MVHRGISYGAVPWEAEGIPLQGMKKAIALGTRLSKPQV